MNATHDTPLNTTLPLSREVFVTLSSLTLSLALSLMISNDFFERNLIDHFFLYQQSSTDIWHAVCSAVKSACSHAKVEGEEVKGIGFAATCSLVAVDADDSPVTVSWSGDSRRNIIVWMDHRALKQAEKINSHNSPVLQYCGGSVSPEMQPPKLLWVKENLQESWSMAFRWMDLSDWLSYRATGDDTRSLCTTVCKWTYLGHAHMQRMNERDSRDMEACGWDDDFWEEIGLGDLVEGHHAKIGRSVAFPGHALGSGLTATAAKARNFELGLVAKTPVGTSLIDAHAGGVGVMESLPEKENDNEVICRRMVLVCGTSTCHMAVSRDKLFIPGVWGPFWSAMIPEYWLTEGGQSATGALLDYIIENHAASPQLSNRAASQKTSVFLLLNMMLESMMCEMQCPFIAALTEDTHVLPDFHGNRSPIADPKAKGVVFGLTLDPSEQQLARLYLATVQDSTHKEFRNVWQVRSIKGKDKRLELTSEASWHAKGRGFTYVLRNIWTVYLCSSGHMDCLPMFFGTYGLFTYVLRDIWTDYLGSSESMDWSFGTLIELW
ncbi:FGGY carbohydrate kinase domain-containing protein [Hibiscus syriacus]|uniref:FGGY carbohydrate kinase domain-containing protein n=1 Tax=Hibiscus syriacus TaxID=106335 RepID=A0A6A2XZ76_HIBSY|nr:FGGY carbohydrate kinase domain-containing protein [Hibiscus syriacus]